MTKKRVMDPEGKRRAIMQAGEALLATKGYTNTSMAQIAAEAGVAVGSVYRLFPDKPALLAELHKAMEQRFIDAMRSAWSLEDRKKNPFGPMIEALLDNAETTRETMPLYALTKEVLGSANYAPGQTIRKAIADMYTEGRKSGRFVDMDPTILAAIGHGMVDGGIRAWMENPTKAQRKKVAAELTDLMARAFLK